MKISRHQLALLSFAAFFTQVSHASAYPCVLSYTCVAPSGGTGEAHHTENRAYIGFEWPLTDKASLAPQLVLGLRSLTVKNSNTVSGGDLSVRIDAFHHWVFDNVKLAYVGGNTDLQENIGGGYSFVDARPLATVALQGPYSRIGLDYVFGAGVFKPYIGVNSLKKPEQLSGNSQLTCQSGYTLSNATTFGATAAETTNGMTCAKALPI